MDPLDFEGLIDFNATAHDPPGDEEDERYIKIDKQKRFGRRKIRILQCVYLLAIIVWLILIYYLNLDLNNVLSLLIILLPIFFFMLAVVNIGYLTAEVEDDLFKINYLSIGLVIVLPLLTCLAKDYGGDQDQYLRLIVTALILTMLSLFDCWVYKKWVTVFKHVKSVLQTMSLTLLIYALYSYYVRTGSIFRVNLNKKQ